MPAPSNNNPHIALLRYDRLLDDDSPTAASLNGYATCCTASREIITTLLPILFNQMASTINNFAIATMLSRQEPQEDYGAASAFIFPTQVLIVISFAALLFPLNVMIRGEDDISEKQRKTSLALAISFPIAIVAIGLSFLITRVYPASPEVKSIIDEYCSIFAPTLLLQLPVLAMEQIAIGLQKKKIGNLELLAIGSALNLLVTLGFAFIFTQAFSLGALTKTQLLALSYGIGSIARALLYIEDFYRSDLLTLSSLFNLYSENLNNNLIFVKNLLANGAAIAVQLASEIMAVCDLPYLVPIFLENPTENLNILNVMTNYNLFVVIPTVSLGIASSLIIKDLQQKKEHSSVQLYGKVILGMSTVYNLLCLVVGLSIPEQMAGVFSVHKEDVANVGISGNLRLMFGMVFTGLIFNSYRDVISGALRGLNIFKPPTTASIAFLWLLGFPAKLLFAHFAPNLGVAGLLLGYYSSTFMGALYLLHLWHKYSSAQAAERLANSDGKALREADNYLGQKNDAFFRKLGNTLVFFLCGNTENQTEVVHSSASSENLGTSLL